MNDIAPVRSLLPAPPVRLAGDLVFVSTIHPIGDDDVLSNAPGPSPWTGMSQVAAQTRTLLARLERALSDVGSSMERLLRVEVQLAFADDFVEFREVYREFLPSDPPARTTIVVGDEHLVPGARVTLQAVALAGGSTWERKLVQPAGVPDPMELEHAALAVAAGPFVFCSGLPATDFRVGLAVGDPALATHHTSVAYEQANYVIDNLAAVLQECGSGLDQGLKVQFYEPDLSTFVTVDRVWGERVGVPPTRSSMACRDLLVPGAVWIASLLALVPGNGLAKEETRAGLAWHPVDAGKANFSPGILAGDWLFTAGQIPVPDITERDWVGVPPGLRHHGSEIEVQTGFTLELLQTQLQANGHDLSDVVDAKVYLVEPRRDFRGFRRAWVQAFGADGGPALSIIPSQQADGSSGVLVEGPVVEIELTSLRGSASGATPDSGRPGGSQ